MELIEIRHIANSDLKKVVKVASHKVAIQHLFQLDHGFLKRGKAFGRRAIKNHANHDNGPKVDGLWCNLGMDACDEPFLKQPVRSAVAGGRADIHARGQLCVGKTSIALERPQDVDVDSV